MANAFYDPDTLSARDMSLLRLAIVIGGVLISLFMIGDLQLIPDELRGVYLANRGLLQLPIVFALLALTFCPGFWRFAQPAFFVSILALTFANYYLIHVAWVRADFSFPYEGTLLYAFFGFFVFGMKFRYALWLSLVSSLGFIGLMLLYPIYGDLTLTNIGFVTGSLFIGVIGRYRLDRLLRRLRDANNQLLTLSTRDPLTDLLNRRALTVESERFYDLQRRTGQSLTVFMMDLDHFKQFNDHYGHQAGDRAICCHAQIMGQVFKRRSDILGRYGGEEFLAVTAGNSPSESMAQAEEILVRWRDLAMPNQGPDGATLLSCCIGICQGPAADFESLEDMIRTADQALYRAKNRGRGTFVMARPGVGNDQWANGETVV